MINQIEPWIDYNELRELKRVVDSTFVTEAMLTEEFEEMNRELTGTKHAIAMSNGTVAIYCALKALDIGPGDEVIVPAMTFIATANAVIMAGATPVFCDVYEDTFCMDIEKAEELINPRTKAIMPVHLYGQSADMEKVMEIASKYDLKVVEDAAQGVGVRFLGKHVGTFGDVGVLSFYGNKTITCGEGGMVLTDNDELAARCYKLKNHGRAKKGIFVHEDIGFNFSFTEMQAAVGIAQMKKLPEIMERKRKIYDRYLTELAALKRLHPVFIDPRTDPVFWFTSFLSNETEDLSEYLLDCKIQTRRFFYPLHLQPCYQESNLIKKGNNKKYSVSKRTYDKGISLPSSYTLSEKEQEKVIIKIKNFYANRN
ncbi:MAG: DegT/DnrJ/EryC1/StrS family aminotransferase [Armatimonadetes bacterium]|nr:DegT/DnrJ/EryC1/StrS family aminotransferase [Armatimonadota bacterium]